MSRFARPMLFSLLAIVIASPTLVNAGAPTPFSPPQADLVLFRGATLIDVKRLSAF